MAIMIPAHKKRWIRILSKPYVYEVSVAFLLVFGGSANAIRSFYPDQTNLVGSLWLFSSAGVFAVSVAKSVAMWLVHNEKESTHELTGALHVLHASLVGELTNANTRVRLTIHVPIENGQYLQQVTNYVGDKFKSSGAGRKFAVQCGIIGKAFRERTPQVGVKQCEDYEGFLTELQRDWHFSLPDALQVDPLSRNWMAVPILSEGSPVYGILYADATDSGFFDDSKQAMVFSACTGIAEYVVRRYKA